ncbi:MAG: N-acetylmuramoyl-L-alanine amidase [Bacteroidales bacterium]
MKRNILLILIGILLNPAVNQVFGQNHKNYSASEVKTIVIDPGHGGKDSGALGRHSKEKDIALSVALKAGDYIKKNIPGVKVVYTRSTDKFIKVIRRAQIANEVHADLFISIHCNSARSSQAKGAETFVMGLHKSASNLEVAKRENSVIMYEEDQKVYGDFNPSSTDSYIIFSLVQDAFLDKSTDIAGKIQDQFVKRVGRHDRGVKQAGFLVLHAAYMPRILVELGFLSHPAEEKFLKSEKGQVYMASAIYRAVRNYKQEHDKRIQLASKEAGKEDNKSTTKSTVNKANGLCYRVQFGTFRKKISYNSSKFKSLKDIHSYRQGRKYKYTAGKFNSYKEAEAYKGVISKLGYKDAFIVAFQDEKRINLSEARKLTNEL